MAKQVSDIAKIDPNLEVKTTLSEKDIVFCDVTRAPFDLYGLMSCEQGFCRLPTEVAERTSDGVLRLHRNSAGGRVRFCTDSRYVAVRVSLGVIHRMSHMTMACSAGVDLYIDDEVTATSRHYRTFFPPYDTDGQYESILYFPTRKPRYITLHLPLYSSLDGFEIGLQADATVDHGLAYRPLAPVVYYGSSITQGGCASRPGNAYTNVVSRRMNIDHVNLGFSGNAKGESAIVDYMAGLTMSAFVCDYDHNAPSVDHLRATHEPLYRAIRAAHPDIPYIMMTRPDFDGDRANSAARRDVVYETYRRALSEGDRNVYFIDGERLLSGPYLDMATVDGCHPTDLGFALMADAVTDVLTRALSVSNA